MIKYVLTSEQARNAVDLRDYSRVLDATVCATMRTQGITLEAGSNYFVVYADRPVTEEEFSQINQALASSALGKYKVEGHPLFTATQCEDDRPDPDVVKEDKYSRFLHKLNE